MAADRRNLRVLVSWHIDPRYIPPFRLAERQVSIGPQTQPDQPPELYDALTPTHRYDLAEVLDSKGIDRNFDLIVVYADSAGSNRPVNLRAFDCPKLLCVGDTHHLVGPISKMLPYAAGAGFDHVVLAYTRQHLHWFVEAGLPEVAWIPGITVRHMPRPWVEARVPRLGFVGWHGRWHPRRRFLLDQLAAHGIPLEAGEGSREAAADLYAGSLGSFNCSLNGDLNMRVFEVMSAGGCLITDRLAPEAGLGLFCEEDRDYLGYDAPEELIEKARALLADPAKALRIARAGHRTYVERLLPERQIAALLDWVLDGRLDPIYRAAGEPRCARPPLIGLALERRLAIYEKLQQAHTYQGRPRVLYAAGLPRVLAEDAIDLPRLIRVLAPLGPDRPPPAGPPPADPRLVVMSWAEAAARRWDFVVAPPGLPIPPELAGAQLLVV